MTSLSVFFFVSSRRRHTRCALVTGVQTCALPISTMPDLLPAAGETRTEMIRGPAGLIETSFAGPRPVGATSLAEPGYALICHPHPLMGGALSNKEIGRAHV